MSISYIFVSETIVVTRCQEAVTIPFYQSLRNTFHHIFFWVKIFIRELMIVNDNSSN